MLIFRQIVNKTSSTRNAERLEKMADSGEKENLVMLVVGHFTQIAMDHTKKAITKLFDTIQIQPVSITSGRGRFSFGVVCVWESDVEKALTLAGTEFRNKMIGVRIRGQENGPDKRTILLKNLAPGTTKEDIRKAIPGCVYVHIAVVTKGSATAKQIVGYGFVRFRSTIASDKCLVQLWKKPPVIRGTQVSIGKKGEDDIIASQHKIDGLEPEGDLSADRTFMLKNLEDCITLEEVRCYLPDFVKKVDRVKPPGDKRYCTVVTFPNEFEAERWHKEKQKNPLVIKNKTVQLFFKGKEVVAADPHAPSEDMTSSQPKIRKGHTDIGTRVIDFFRGAAKKEVNLEHKDRQEEKDKKNKEMCKSGQKRKTGDVTTVDLKKAKFDQAAEQSDELKEPNVPLSAPSTSKALAKGIKLVLKPPDDDVDEQLSKAMRAASENWHLDLLLLPEIAQLRIEHFEFPPSVIQITDFTLSVLEHPTLSPWMKQSEKTLMSYEEDKRILILKYPTSVIARKAFKELKFLEKSGHIKCSMFKESGLLRQNLQWIRELMEPDTLNTKSLDMSVLPLHNILVVPTLSPNTSEQELLHAFPEAVLCRIYFSENDFRRIGLLVFPTMPQMVANMKREDITVNGVNIKGCSYLKAMEIKLQMEPLDFSDFYDESLLRFEARKDLFITVYSLLNAKQKVAHVQAGTFIDQLLRKYKQEIENDARERCDYKKHTNPQTRKQQIRMIISQALKEVTGLPYIMDSKFLMHLKSENVLSKMMEQRKLKEKMADMQKEALELALGKPVDVTAMLKIVPSVCCVCCSHSRRLSAEKKQTDDLFCTKCPESFDLTLEKFMTNETIAEQPKVPTSAAPAIKIPAVTSTVTTRSNAGVTSVLGSPSATKTQLKPLTVTTEARSGLDSSSVTSSKIQPLMGIPVATFPNIRPLIDLTCGTQGSIGGDRAQQIKRMTLFCGTCGYYNVNRKKTCKKCKAPLKVEIPIQRITSATVTDSGQVQASSTATTSSGVLLKVRAVVADTQGSATETEQGLIKGVKDLIQVPKSGTKQSVSVVVDKTLVEISQSSTSTISQSASSSGPQSATVSVSQTSTTSASQSASSLHTQSAGASPSANSKPVVPPPAHAQHSTTTVPQYGAMQSTISVVSHQAVTHIYPPGGIPPIPSTIPQVPGAIPQVPGTIPCVPDTIPQVPGTNPQVPHVPGTIPLVSCPMPEIPPPNVVSCQIRPVIMPPNQHISRVCGPLPPVSIGSAYSQAGPLPYPGAAPPRHLPPPGYSVVPLGLPPTGYNIPSPVVDMRAPPPGIGVPPLGYPRALPPPSAFPPSNQSLRAPVTLTSQPPPASSEILMGKGPAPPAILGQVSSTSAASTGSQSQKEKEEKIQKATEAVNTLIGFSKIISQYQEDKDRREDKIRSRSPDALGGRRFPAALGGRRFPDALGGRRSPDGLGGRRSPALCGRRFPGALGDRRSPDALGGRRSPDALGGRRSRSPQSKKRRYDYYPLSPICTYIRDSDSLTVSSGSELSDDSSYKRKVLRKRRDSNRGSQRQDYSDDDSLDSLDSQSPKRSPPRRLRDRRSHHERSRARRSPESRSLPRRSPARPSLVRRSPLRRSPARHTPPSGSPTRHSPLRRSQLRSSPSRPSPVRSGRSRERSYDRTSEHERMDIKTQEFSNVESRERKKEGTKERSHERSNERLHEQHTERSHGRPRDHSRERSNDDQKKRSTERSNERHRERSGEQSYHKIGERSHKERSYEISIERSYERSCERSYEKSSERSHSRRGEQSHERSYERRSERSIVRPDKRSYERSYEKSKKRPHMEEDERSNDGSSGRSYARKYKKATERSSKRSNTEADERSHERSYERISERSIVRPDELSRERSYEKLKELSHTRADEKSSERSNVRVDGRSHPRVHEQSNERYNERSSERVDERSHARVDERYNDRSSESSRKRNSPIRSRHSISPLRSKIDISTPLRITFSRSGLKRESAHRGHSPSYRCSREDSPGPSFSYTRSISLDSDTLSPEPQEPWVDDLIKRARQLESYLKPHSPARSTRSVDLSDESLDNVLARELESRGIGANDDARYGKWEEERGKLESNPQRKGVHERLGVS